MKKFVFMGLLFSNLIIAQIPVTDAATGAQLTALNTQSTISNQNLAQQLSTAGSQLTQLQQTYKQIKEISDKVEEVNSAIESYKKVEELIAMQKEGLENLNDYIKNTEALKGKVDEKKVEAIIGKFSKILIDVNKVIQNGIFNMNDKERVDYMDKRKLEVTNELLKTRMLKIMTSK